MEALINMITSERAQIEEEILYFKNANPQIPIYIWGGGSVAYGVMKRLVVYGINFDGFFVNIDDAHIDGRIKTGGYQVYTLSELEKKNMEFAVVMGHSHYELLPDIIKNPKVMKVWFFVDTVRMDSDISYDLISDNQHKFQKTYDNLADELSRRNLIAYLNAKVSGNISYIWSNYDSTASNYFTNDVIKLRKHESYLDIGAYNGCSIDDFLDAYDGDDYFVTAIEVQKDQYDMLCKKYSHNARIRIINMGVSDHIGTDYFDFDEQSTCLSYAQKGLEQRVTTVDEIGNKLDRLTIIKICIGGTIKKILYGAKETIKNHLPQLVIAAGIDKMALADYVDILERITEGGKYSYYLRFTSPMPAALVLYAVPK